MATGRLGAADIAATTNTTVYTCPAATYAVVAVNICNRSGTLSSDIRVALATLDTPTDAQNTIELIPNWKSLNSPLKTQAKEDKFLYLTETKSYQFPTPPQMHNKGNYIISLGDFCKWLGEQAEALEVEIYPGFSASEILFDENNTVTGVDEHNIRNTRRYRAFLWIYIQECCIVD